MQTDVPSAPKTKLPFSAPARNAEKPQVWVRKSIIPQSRVFLNSNSFITTSPSVRQPRYECASALPPDLRHYLFRLFG